MTEMRNYMKLVEAYRSGLTHSSLRGEDIFVHYEIHGDQIEWSIEGMTLDQQRALNLTRDEIEHIDDACVEDADFSF